MSESSSVQRHQKILRHKQRNGRWWWKNVPRGAVKCKHASTLILVRLESVTSNPALHREQQRPKAREGDRTEQDRVIEPTEDSEPGQRRNRGRYRLH